MTTSSRRCTRRVSQGLLHTFCVCACLPPPPLAAAPPTGSRGFMRVHPPHTALAQHMQDKGVARREEVEGRIDDALVAAWLQAKCRQVFRGCCARAAAGPARRRACMRELRARVVRKHPLCSKCARVHKCVCSVGSRECSGWSGHVSIGACGALCDGDVHTRERWLQRSLPQPGCACAAACNAVGEV
jgi:hypothetical protein